MDKLAHLRSAISALVRGSFFSFVLSLPSVAQEGFWLSCEATRQGDHQKVKYLFHVVGNRAYAKYGTWTYEPGEREIHMFYIKRGQVQADTMITINRITGDVYHYAGGGVSIYETTASDKPCEDVTSSF